jgi:hypothetical protein
MKSKNSPQRHGAPEEGLVERKEGLHFQAYDSIEKKPRTEKFIKKGKLLRGNS